MCSATQGEKAALVKELREEGYPLKYLLPAMGLSKSTYYYEIGKIDKVQARNSGISSEISSIFMSIKEDMVYDEYIKSFYGVVFV